LSALCGSGDLAGNLGDGTVIRISLPPQLTIVPSEKNVILTWPTNDAGFDYTGYTLQSTPAISATFTNVLGATSPYTNATTSSQQFFRLASP